MGGYISDGRRYVPVSKWTAYTDHHRAFNQKVSLPKESYSLMAGRTFSNKTLITNGGHWRTVFWSTLRTGKIPGEGNDYTLPGSGIGSRKTS